MLALFGHMVFERLPGVLIHSPVHGMKEKYQTTHGRQDKDQKRNQIPTDAAVFLFSKYM